MFEWDEEKRSFNLAKHGIDFADAQMLFDGRDAVTVPSSRGDEARFATTGQIDGLFYTVIWTERASVIRLISARRARDVEKRAYRALFGE